MDNSKLNGKKTYEYVFDYFSEQILSGKLKLNDKIPTEREIAEQLGVSRNSIREVMHMLEITGLIECLHGSGNYVRCDPVEYMLKSVNMVMALLEIDYAEIFHIRTGYEYAAVRREGRRRPRKSRPCSRNGRRTGRDAPDFRGNGTAHERKRKRKAGFGFPPYAGEKLP